MSTHNQTSMNHHTQSIVHGASWVDHALAQSRGQNPAVRHALATSGWLFGLNGLHLGEDLRLYPGPNTIGSSARCNVVVTAPNIGRQHAVIDVLSGESAILHPGSSQRPLLLNGEQCHEAAPLCHGDMIQLGVQQFAFITLLPVPTSNKIIIRLQEKPQHKTPFTLGWLIALNGEHEGRDFRLFYGENRIGSQPGLEIVLPDEDLKPKHCLITRHDQNWTIVPLSLSDILFINGVPSSGAGLENGDIITIGKREFLFRSLRVAYEE